MERKGNQVVWVVPISLLMIHRLKYVLHIVPCTTLTSCNFMKTDIVVVGQHATCQGQHLITTHHLKFMKGDVQVQLQFNSKYPPCESTFFIFSGGGIFRGFFNFFKRPVKTIVGFGSIRLRYYQVLE